MADKTEHNVVVASATEGAGEGATEGAGERATEGGTEGVKMPRHQRYYAIHREQELAKDREKYNNKPEVIAKRKAREQKKAEKEAEKEAKRIEKERIRQEKLALALASKQKVSKTQGGLDSILSPDCPA